MRITNAKVLILKYILHNYATKTHRKKNTSTITVAFKFKYFYTDIDECSEGLHECTAGQLCKNRAGSYVCHCPPGHYMTKDKKCEDINECEKYGSRVSYD